VPRLTRLILIFSVTFALFSVGPPALGSQFGPYPLMKLGDVFDLLTPLVLIPLYWLLYQVGQDKKPGLREGVAFMVLAALWVLSHYLWHFAVVGLSALLLVRQWQNPFTEERASPGVLLLAGIIYGLTFFVIVVEGGTALLGIPLALIVIVVGLMWGRDRLRERPLLLFFLVSYVVAILFFAGWGIYWGGLPEFSELGLI
jgi:hypothetical protein